MRKKSIFLFFFVTMLIISFMTKKSDGNGSSERKSDGVTLTLNLSKGKMYQMTISVVSDAEMVTNKTDVTESEMKSMNGQKTTVHTTGTMGYDFEIKDILQNGNFLIRTTRKNLKMSQSFGGVSFEYDSETGKSSGMNQNMTDYIKKTIGQWIETELDKNSKIISSISSDPSLSNPMDDVASVFSGNKVKVGDSWVTDRDANIKSMTGILIATVKTNFKLVSLKDGVAELSFDGNYQIKEAAEGTKLSGLQSGKTKIDMATGLPKEIIMDQEFDIVGMNKNGVALPTKMKNKITIEIK
ncbi:hypothetical protein HUU42_10310 [bacterium]|nr:hypothetical protein [bacterium]